MMIIISGKIPAWTQIQNINSPKLTLTSFTQQRLD